MHLIHTINAPAPAGHYSQATVYENLIFVSGQLPISPSGTHMTNAAPEQQTLQALENVEAILVAAGSDLNHVLQMTIYIDDMGCWEEVNAVCAEKFGNHKPARAIVPVSELHHGLKVEIQAIAFIP